MLAPAIPRQLTCAPSAQASGIAGVKAGGPNRRNRRNRRCSRHTRGASAVPCSQVRAPQQVLRRGRARLGQGMACWATARVHGTCMAQPKPGMDLRESLRTIFMESRMPRRRQRLHMNIQSILVRWLQIIIAGCQHVQRTHEHTPTLPPNSPPRTHLSIRAINTPHRSAWEQRPLFAAACRLHLGPASGASQQDTSPNGRLSPDRTISTPPTRSRRNVASENHILAMNPLHCAPGERCIRVKARQVGAPDVIFNRAPYLSCRGHIESQDRFTRKVAVVSKTTPGYQERTWRYRRRATSKGRRSRRSAGVKKRIEPTMAASSLPVSGMERALLTIRNRT